MLERGGGRGGEGREGVGEGRYRDSMQLERVSGKLEETRGGGEEKERGRGKGIARYSRG